MIYRPSRRVQVFVVLVVMGGMFIGARSAASWRPRKVKVSKAAVLAIAFAPDGNEIICATGDGKWQSVSVSALNVTRVGDGHLPCKVATLSDDGHTLLTTDFHHVKLWHLWPNKILWQRSYDPLSGCQTDLVGLSGTGNRFFIDEAVFHYISAYTGKIERTHTWLDDARRLYGKNGNPINVLALSREGLHLAYGGASYTGLWNTRTRKDLWTLKLGKALIKGSLDTPTAFRFSPKEHLLAVAYSSLQVHLLDVRTGKLVSPLAGNYSRPIVDFAFSPDGQMLAGSNDSGDFWIWNVSSSRQIKYVSGIASKWRALAFSPDGYYLALGTSGGEVQIWRVK